MTKISVIEMSMLKWMCGNTRKDINMNANIRDIVRVAPIKDKLRENKLR